MHGRLSGSLSTTHLFKHFNATIRINRHMDLGTKGRLRRLNQPFSPNLDEKDGLSNLGRCSIVKGRLRWTGSCTPPHSLPKNDANAAFSMRFDDGLGCVSIFVFTLSDAAKRLQAPSEVEGQIPNRQTQNDKQAIK